MRLWTKVRESALYKMIFVFIMGICGAAIGAFFAVLFLWGYEYKWVLILIGSMSGILLSNFQYRLWDKKYDRLKNC